MRAVLLVAMLVLVCAPSAGAVTLVRPDGSVAQPWQRWADRAKVPTAPGSVEVIDAPCPDYAAERSCAEPWGPRIYLNPTDTRRRSQGRFLLLHELGHVFDFTRTPGGPWTETFANVYAMCALGFKVRRTLAGGCVGIRHAGGWFMRPTWARGTSASKSPARRARR